MTTTQTKTKWRAVAIPSEHGGWGIVLEPILLGFLVVPSVTGLFMALAVFASFLARTPFKIVWKDIRRGRQHGRTKAAVQVLVLYGSFVIIGFAGAVYTGGIRAILPLLLTSPIIIVQTYFDLFSTNRKIIPELMAPIALASVAGGMALAAGWTWPQALILWTIPILRSIPSILYVRTRLQLTKKKSVSIIPSVIVNIVAFVIGVMMGLSGWIPYWTTAVLFILSARAIHGLSPYRGSVATKTIGWMEVGFGLLTVIATAIGYHLW